MKWIRRLALLLAVLVLAVAALAFGSRFADGPLEPFRGGPFKSGEWVEDPDVNWLFAADVKEVELESGEGSRITWILVVDGEAYVPCSLRFPPGKRWHLDALEDPRAVLRIDGRRFRRRLVREEDPARRQRLFDVGRAKYGYPPDTPLDQIWFFRLAPPGA